MKYSLAKTTFDSAAPDYDRLRRKLIPCFDEFYHGAIKQIPFRSNTAIRILDLGAGTGLLSEYASNAFPNAAIMLADFSEAMLEKARLRLDDKSEHMDFLTIDYAHDEIPTGYDAVISALSIHHLTDSDKHAVFSRVFSALRPGGVFVNADNIRGANPVDHEQNRKIWITRIRELGVTETELENALERTKADQLATLEEQLEWLRDAGFYQVNCAYKWLHFAVMVGKR